MVSVTTCLCSLFKWSNHHKASQRPYLPTGSAGQDQRVFDSVHQNISSLFDACMRCLPTVAYLDESTLGSHPQGELNRLRDLPEGFHQLHHRGRCSVWKRRCLRNHPATGYLTDHGTAHQLDLPQMCTSAYLPRRLVLERPACIVVAVGTPRSSRVTEAMKRYHQCRLCCSRQPAEIPLRPFFTIGMRYRGIQTFQR